MKLEDAIKGIMKVREIVHKQKMWNDPNALSDAMLRLSVFNSYLADNTARLHKTATDSHYAIYTECKTKGLATNAAEAEARGMSTEERYEAENINNIYKATGNLITAIQVRLKAIQRQMEQEGVEQ